MSSSGAGRLALALDTSTRQGSVALGWVGDSGLELLGEETLEVSATHSETVLPAIDRLLRDAGCRPGELELVAVGAGPGSFTGVRIGAALARGLCFPERAELYAYSSLAAIAAGAEVAGDVCALLDARRGQVYAAGYSIGPGGLETKFPPEAGALTELLARLDPEAWIFAGSLTEMQRTAVESAGRRLLPAGQGRPTGTGLLRLVRLDADGGRVADPARWEPEYVRASSAERRLEKT